MPIAYIALGSNLENPAQQLQAACDAMAAATDVHIIAGSSVFRSAAVGPGPQPDYLNAVVAIATSLPAEALLDRLQAVEQARGRERGVRWGPRTLDLDLLLYDELSVDDARLTLPHPRLHERDFVLYPLREISDANLVLPDGRDLATLIRSCPDNGLARTGCLTPIH